MSRHVRRNARGPASPAAALRRTRARRVLAFGGMLAAVGGLVTARGAVAPAPSQALSTTGMAAPVSQGAQSPSPAPRHQRTRHHHHHHHHASASAPSAQPTHTTPVRHTVTGDPFDVGYGTVQVRIVLVGHHLSDVTAISLPSGGHSSEVSNYAAPRLRQEALAAQSARIDTVSGASYTSAGYAKSLQSALDKGARLS